MTTRVRTLVRSPQATRKQARLEEAGHTNYESRQQATKYHAKLFIKRAFKEPFKEVDKMRKQVNHIKKNDHMTATKLRMEQKMNDFEKRIDKWTNNTRANRRQASNLSGAPMTIPIAIDNKMTIKNFSPNTVAGTSARTYHLRGTWKVGLSLPTHSVADANNETYF